MIELLLGALVIVLAAGRNRRRTDVQPAARDLTPARARRVALASLLLLAGCTSGTLRGSPLTAVADATPADLALAIDAAARDLGNTDAPTDGVADASPEACTPDAAGIDGGDAATPSPIDAAALVVYGAFANPGNQVCAATHPPATAPCAGFDEGWLSSVYGVTVARSSAATAAPTFRLVQAIEREGPVALEVWLVDELGAPLTGGAAVVFCYPVVDGPAGQPSCAANLLEVQPKPSGVAEFVLTGDAYKGCGERGPIAAWVSAPGAGSDRVFGLGMLVNTNHRHVNLLFQRTGDGAAVAATRCPL